MKKSDLKSGMWVELRNGDKYLILTNANTLNYGNNTIVGLDRDGFGAIGEYNADLIHPLDNDYDIVKIFYDGYVNRATYSFNNIPLLWERKEHTELSIAEIEKKLDLPSGTLRIKKDS